MSKEDTPSTDAINRFYNKMYRKASSPRMNTESAREEMREEMRGTPGGSTGAYPNPPSDDQILRNYDRHNWTGGES